MAGAALLAALAAAPPARATDGVSVAVHASGTAHEGQRVSYAIEVRNPTDHPMPDTVVTQQLPPNLAFLAASPAAHRDGDGRHLTWTLAVPAHGVARITMTGAARRAHHESLVHSGRHAYLTTTVCVQEDQGVPACTKGRSALRTDRTPSRQRGAAAAGVAAAACGAVLAAVRLRRGRRSRQVGAI